MKPDEKKSKNKKTFFEKILNSINKISAKDILFVLLLATGILVILGVLAKKELLSVYFSGIALSSLPVVYYFDLIVRNGILKYLYFAIVIVLVYMMGTNILKASKKKKINIPFKAIIVVVGFIIAFLIYLVPAYYLENYEPLTSSFWPYPTEEDIHFIDHQGCDDRIDFLFSPSSEIALKVIPEIVSIRNQGIPINIYCIGDQWINDDILCEKKFGLASGKGEKIRDQFGIIQEFKDPIFITGCKQWIVPRQNKTDTKKYICENTNLCT
ncbi:MAG: hypothetical protein KKF46_06550 [Nanoarchaeota archaeon]|nr:hypothetical protein [Nanoarchaeota archaeon]MBU1321989.1 hypothetical protein [Nanoarchaeota archaeon]MBU1597979.1 hypothetical protein [Nanoarchaeota archaeon]